MLDKKNSLVKNSILYVILGFLPLAVNLILAPVYSTYISPQQYGLVALANIFQGLLTVAISLGLDGAFSRLYFDYHKKDKLVKGLMSTVLITIVTCSLFFWVILHFSGDFIFKSFLKNKLFTYSKYGDIVFFTTFSTVIHAIFLSYYRNKEKVLAYSFVSLSFFFTSVTGILIGIVYFKAEAMGNIVGRAAGASLVACLLLLVYFIRHRLQFKIAYLKTCLNYSLPLIPYLILLIAYNNVDKIMVEQYFELDALGLYNFAFLLSSVISVFIYAVFNAVSPRVYKLLTQGGDTSFNEIRKINLLFHILVLGVISFAIAMIIPALNIFIADEYQSIKDYIGILILVYVFQLYYVIYTIPLFFHKKTKVLPFISLVILIVGVISNIVFIPFLGIYGVCLSLFVTKLAQFATAYAFNRSFGYNRSSYLNLTKNHIISLLIIIPFVGAFVLNHIFQLYPVFIINLIPIAIFAISVILFFKSELSSLSKMVKTIFE